VGGNPLIYLDELGLAFGFDCVGCHHGGMLNQPPMASPVQRPKNMTRLEERQFDRHCASSNDPCGELKLAVQQAIDGLREKIDAMKKDSQGLYKNARSTPNPDVTKSPTTWDNHRSDALGRLENIWAMISLGEKLGCDMSAEKAQAMTLLVPIMPD